MAIDYWNTVSIIFKLCNPFVSFVSVEMETDINEERNYKKRMSNYCLNAI